MKKMQGNLKQLKFDILDFQIFKKTISSVKESVKRKKLLLFFACFTNKGYGRYITVSV